MPDEDFEQIPDELKAYKQQLDAVKADIEILIRFANPHLLGQVDNYILNKKGTDPTGVAECVDFLKRHPKPLP
jgi:hypothetical protein